MSAYGLSAMISRHLPWIIESPRSLQG